jgi:hypothetical protein
MFCGEQKSLSLCKSGNQVARSQAGNAMIEARGWCKDHGTPQGELFWVLQSLEFQNTAAGFLHLTCAGLGVPDVSVLTTADWSTLVIPAHLQLPLCGLLSLCSRSASPFAFQSIFLNWVQCNWLGFIFLNYNHSRVWFL